MEELSNTSYSNEARQKFKVLHPKAWTEEDQKRVDEQYAFLASELTRLGSYRFDDPDGEVGGVGRLPMERVDRCGNRTPFAGF